MLIIRHSTFFRQRKRLSPIRRQLPRLADSGSLLLLNLLNRLDHPLPSSISSLFTVYGALHMVHGPMNKPTHSGRHGSPKSKDWSLENARIMTFGYDSSWNKIWNSNNVLDIPDFARQFVNDLWLHYADHDWATMTQTHKHNSAYSCSSKKLLSRYCVNIIASILYTKALVYTMLIHVCIKIRSIFS
jgi:hypothetical protein